MLDPIQVLNDHIPSLTDDDEDKITGRAFGATITGECWDAGDFAVRTCHCGAKIDGFYEYVDHLKAEFTRRMRPMCEQSFMAGAICILPAEHSGAHASGE